MFGAENFKPLDTTLTCVLKPSSFHRASLLQDPEKTPNYFTLQKVNKEKRMPVKASRTKGANFLIFLWEIRPLYPRALLWL